MMRKPILSEIVKIILNCAVVPLYFIRFFHEVAVLPVVDMDGNYITTSRTDYYYSIFYKLNREGLVFLLWIAVVISVVSIVISVFGFVVKDGKILKIASNILFAISVAFFLVLLFVSLQISYAY